LASERTLFFCIKYSILDKIMGMVWMIRVKIYSRVSTTKQEAESQESAMRRYVLTLENAELIGSYEDVISGGTMDRNALNTIRHDARTRKFDLLVIWAMDRLTRGGIGPLLSILLELESNGVAVYSLQEPYLSTLGDARPLILSVLAWIAAQEKKRISERTKAGLKRIVALRKTTNPEFKLGRPKGTKDKKPRLKRGPSKTIEQKGLF
jgi:putative DNA-invertase from lambdoid prophage Rac